MVVSLRNPSHLQSFSYIRKALDFIHLELIFLCIWYEAESLSPYE